MNAHITHRTDIAAEENKNVSDQTDRKRRNSCGQMVDANDKLSFCRFCSASGFSPADNEDVDNDNELLMST